MNENAVKSQKIKLGKKMIIVWAAAAVLLILVTVISLVKYSGYKKAQDAAISVTMAATSQFNSYKDDREELVEKIYRFYNPTRLNVTVDGIKIDNSEVVSSARDADKELANVLNKMGFDCYRGSDYLEYAGFVDYASNEMVVLYIVWGVLAVVLLAATLWCLADSKKAMIIDGDRIVCMNGKKTAKEFMLKDVKSVELASLKGLAVRGNGIKYKINLLQNADEIRTTIMGALAAMPSESAAAAEIPTSAADELKKYKELLDNGVISQEEFDAKKKQLLGLY